MNAERIYLDHAATSWPKRESVVRAAFDFTINCGATAGRGTYTSAMEADRWISEARRQVAKLIGADQASSIAFTSSGTHSLNAALLGLLNEGDHVLATQAEHNSALRPLRQLEQSGRIELDFIPCDQCGLAKVDRAKSLLRANTKLIVATHASNVTGVVQDITALSDFAKQANSSLLLDASQTLGYLPIDVQRLGIDILAAAAHKGLGALAGTGLIYVAPNLPSKLKPLMTGGTGLSSEQINVANTWPQVVEVGNHNMPGIVSIAVAAKELVEQADAGSLESSAKSALKSGWQSGWRVLLRRLVEGLKSIPGVELVGRSCTDFGQGVSGEAPALRPDYVPVVSLNLQGWSPQDLAVGLDSSFGIEVRAGYHCAALIHEAIGSKSDGGTLRISLGHSTTEVEVDKLLAALREVALQSA
ncbi:MAG: aminotransferase class V-fold PLP-dependent enzyme [Pirellulales bacterium]